jgi:hypothetical protein
MSREHGDVINSRSAKEIAAFCHTLAQELRLTLAYDVTLDHVLSPEHIEDPYGVTMSVTQPFEEYLQIYFTREEVLGYATGETKAAVQNKIRTDLEAHIRIRDSHQ